MRSKLIPDNYVGGRIMNFLTEVELNKLNTQRLLKLKKKLDKKYRYQKYLFNLNNGWGNDDEFLLLDKYFGLLIEILNKREHVVGVKTNE